jgi:cytosine-specific methyltransferase
MQMFYEDEQISMFAPDSCAGKMSPVHSPAGSKREMTSGSSWKKHSELVYQEFMFLKITLGDGDILGQPYWEILSPYVGESSTLNTGVCPRVVRESSLWQILEPHPQRKYYLSRKACLGILRRARKRGKELPATLKLALEMQSGLRMIDLVILAQMGLIKAYHINQRNEGIDLGDTAGALMATSNLQMQTFVAGTSVAFAANQRDEVRDLGDKAGALGAQPGMKQQTFVAGFSAGAGASAGGIGYREGVAPTLKAGGSGNSMPTVLCINDQGGERMDVTVDKTATLRAQMGNHQPLIFESHGIDARYRQMGDVAPTMSARYGTGGNNVPLVGEQVFCITGNAIDRELENGGNGIGYQENVSYTLTGFDRHAVCSVSEVVGALCKGDEKGAGSQYVEQGKCVVDLYTCEPAGDKDLPILLIRRLTPLECERLQGFPDGWTDIPGASDSARYKALGNSVAIPCVDFVMKCMADAIRGSN